MHGGENENGRTGREIKTEPRNDHAQKLAEKKTIFGLLVKEGAVLLSRQKSRIYFYSKKRYEIQVWFSTEMCLCVTRRRLFIVMFLANMREYLLSRSCVVAVGD